MPRIAEPDIERVKRDTDLLSLIQSRGVSLTRKGKNWTGLCPFHGDRSTPNLIVTPGKGLWRCMACGAAGNAIQFVQRHDGLSFRHAFELLSEGGKAAFEGNGRAGPAKASTVPKLPCPLGGDSEGSALLAEVAGYYHERLAHSPPALGYLKTRGLDDEGLCRRFRAGFADRTLGLRIPQANRKAGGEMRGRLKELGVLRPNGREHLHGCLVVPVTTMDGWTTQLYGRRVDPKAAKDSRHLYLPRPLAGVFNPSAFESREIILCESVLDAMTFARHGMDSATCAFGTAGMNDDLEAAIKARKVETVRIAYDSDKAGEKAFQRDAELLMKQGLEILRVKLPWGADPNSYALDQGGEALRKAVRNAAWSSAGLHPAPPAAPPNGNPHPSSNKSQETASSLAAKEAAPGPPAPVAAQPEAAKEKKESASSAQFDSVHLRSAPVAVPPTLERKGEHHEAAFGSASHLRRYRVTGLEKNNGLETLKITLRLEHCPAGDGASRPGGTGGAQALPLLHVDAIDLCRDADRRRFTDRAAEETLLEKDLLKRDLGKLLLLLEQAQEERLGDPEPTTNPVEMTPEEEQEAMKFLKSPDLLEKITEAYAASGVVGESANLLAAYLACVSRKLPKPLAVIIQSTSAAGKSTLMEAVLSFFPPEEVVKYSAMTGQSLYYMGEADLKHKVLAIAEEEGAEKASYALKLLQSEGELTIASTGKDPHSGRMETQEYHVEGPCAIVLTTTSIDIDEELMNRCLVLTVDESREQTERIHQLQREARTPDGLRAAEERKATRKLMQNAQRLLQPVPVTSPHAPALTFTADRSRTRRDHEKYLTLIDSIALLHQHQREAVEITETLRALPVEIDDIEAANRIAPEVLGRSLDELPPQTRRLLEKIQALVKAKMEAEDIVQPLALFTRRELREATGWSETQVRRHLELLEQMEYIARRGGRQGKACLHELLVDADEASGLFHIGLIDTDELRRKQDEK